MFSANRHDTKVLAEQLLVTMASCGDRDAFAELVRRRQSWARNLMRRFSGNSALADDLAQQMFLQAYRNIGSIRSATAFGGWLKRIAVTTWLQHTRRQDPLWNASDMDDWTPSHTPQGGLALDLDKALNALPAPVRTCVILSYHENMPHAEIAEATGLPVGTVKSHIRRGSEQLRTALAAYRSEDQRNHTHA